MATHVEQAATEVVALRAGAAGDPRDEVGPGTPALRRREVTVPNHNGRVGIWGVSYSGFYTLAGIIDTHPAIKAASPQAPAADLFLDDDWYHGGAFMLAHAFNSAPVYQPQSGPTPPPKAAVPFDCGTEDGYEFFLKVGPLGNAASLFGAANPTWDELVTHPTYDEFWQSRAIWRHLKNVRCAVLTVGGWFDAEDLMGSLRAYRTIKTDTMVSAVQPSGLAHIR